MRAWLSGCSSWLPQLKLNQGIQRNPRLQYLQDISTVIASSSEGG